MLCIVIKGVVVSTQFIAKSVKEIIAKNKENAAMQANSNGVVIPPTENPTVFPQPVPAAAAPTMTPITAPTAAPTTAPECWIRSRFGVASHGNSRSPGSSCSAFFFAA